MISRVRRRRTTSDTEINVTPLLDVVFIMLIFFVLTTSLVKELGVDLDRPSNAPVEEKKRSDVIAVRIEADGRIFVGERQVNVVAVRANIVAGLVEKPDAAVVVIADRAADSGFVVQVVDQARLAGARKISLAAAGQ